MNKQKVHCWADAREDVPASFQASLDRTLNGLKEEKPMKRKLSGAVLIAALITALVLGTAYAVVNYQGILDTYHTKPLDGAENYIQNNFEGIVYENDWYTVKVREALTDGITARIMMEYTAKDEKTFLIDEAEDDECGIQIGDDETIKPIAEWRKGYEHVVCIGLPKFVDVEMDGSFGSELHVSANQMLIWWEFEVKSSDAMNAPLGASEAWCVDGGKWQHETCIPQGDTCRFEPAWFVTLKNSVSGNRTVEINKLDKGILHLTNVRFTFTPIYTYVDYTLRVDGLDQAKAAHAVCYTDFCDMNGEMLVSGNGHSTMVAEDGTAVYHDQFSAMTDIPEKLTLQYQQINEDEDGNQLDKIDEVIDIPLN